MRHWPLTWAVVYLVGFGLGGRVPLTLLPEAHAAGSALAARGTALLPVLLAVVPSSGVLPLWLGTLAGGYAAGCLEAGPRQVRLTAAAARSDAVAAAAGWEGPAVLRITGWPAPAGGDRWRAPARLMHHGPGVTSGPAAGPAAGQGVALSGKGRPPDPGAVITGPLQLWPPAAATLPGAFDYRLFLAGRGLTWQGRLADWQNISDHDLVARLGVRFLGPLRRSLVARIGRNLPEQEATMAGAVLLGMRDPESRRASRPFADLGLAHLFAVSGLHVGILLGIILLPGQWAGLSPWQKVVPILLLLPVYVLLTGLPGSVMRAASLGFLALLAAALGRPADPLRLLGLLFWAGTIWDPAQNLDTGLKLSYLAAGGILAVSALTGGLRFSGRRLSGPIGTGLAVSGAAQWFTLPLVAGSFGRISMLSPLANLVAVPLFGVAVWCVVLSLVLGGLWSVPAEAAAALAWALFRVLAGAAAAVSSFSAGYPIGLPAPGVGRLAAWMVLSALGLGALQLRKRGVLSGGQALAAVLAVTGAGLLVFGPAAWHLGSAGKVTAWQFDVGQGDCGLLVFPDGWTLLIDTAGRFGMGKDEDDGPVPRTVLPFLQRNGCSRLDGVVLTHGHLDHTGGAAAVARALAVDMWYVSGRAGACLAGLADSTHIMIPHPGFILHRWRQWEVRVVYARDHPADELDENDRSLVLVLSRAGRDLAVWSGDLEKEGEGLLLSSGHAPRNVQVWKAGHHGSDTSGSPDMLDTLDPRLILVSAGVGNGYRHPSHGPYVVGADTVPLARTDLQGTVLLEWNARGELAWRTLGNGGPRGVVP